MGKYGFILVISICLNVIVLIYFLKNTNEVKNLNIEHVQNVELSKNDSLETLTYNKYKARKNKIKTFQTYIRTSRDIIFLGTSLTEGFRVHEMFYGYGHLVNLGIGGSTSADVLGILDEVYRGSPKKIFIEIGINDIVKFNISNDSIIRNIKTILDQLKKNTDSKIYIQSVLPVGISMKNSNAQIKLLNQAIEALSKTENITYLHFYPEFEKDEVLNPLYTSDDVHLKIDGYLKWKELLERYLIEK
jgi:hypothetical protein